MRCSKRQSISRPSVGSPWHRMHSLWIMGTGLATLPICYCDKIAPCHTRPVSQALGLNVPFGDARLAERSLERAVWPLMRRCEDPSGSRSAGLAFFIAFIAGQWSGLCAGPESFRSQLGFSSMSLSMKPPTEKITTRTWRASVLKRRAEYLGKVHAPNSTAAEVAAIKEFCLNDDQRRRLMLQEER